jgi:hypothetical protein
MTRIPSRGARLRTVLLATVTTTLALLGIASPAAAEYGDPVTVVYSPGTSSVEYGRYWEFSATVLNTSCDVDECTNALSVAMAGESSKKFTTGIWDDMAYFGFYDVSSSALAPGDYTFTGTYVDGSSTMDSGNIPAKLTVTPAAIGIDLRVTTDPLQPAGAVVNAELTGTFVDDVVQCFGSQQCHEPLPAGTWAFTVTDADGTVVTEKSIDSTEGDSQFASFYWHDVPAGADYSATATFTPAQDGFFTVTDAAATSFTSPDPVEVGEPGAPTTPEEEVEVSAGPTLPLWLAILGGVLLLGLAAAAIVVWLLIRRREAGASDDPVEEPSTEEVSV